MKPLLSLGIPTHNRAAFLRILLESLLTAIPPFDERIEVLISDNASSDDTRQVAEEFRARLPRLRYMRNETNIGAEGNLLILADSSAGEYLWLLGDDDVVCADGLRNLLNELTVAPDYLILNYNTIRENGLLSRRPTFSISRHADLNDADQVLSRFGLSNGLLTAVVFRRDAFLAAPREEFLLHSRSGLSFFFTTLWVARKYPRGRFVGHPVFLYRANNSEHAPTPERWVEVYGAGLRKVTSKLKAMGYDSKALRHFHSSIVLKFYAAAILSTRAKARPARAYARSLICHYGDVPLAWALLPIIFAPAFAAARLQIWWRSRKFSRTNAV